MAGAVRPERPAHGQYFLWSGRGAVTDLDHAETVEDALQALRCQCPEGDWTLWHRWAPDDQGLASYKARLIAVKVRGQVLRFDHDLIDRVT